MENSPDWIRFLSKTKIVPGPLDTPCRIWTAAIKPNRRGVPYGRFSYKGKTIPAHRFAYFFLNPKKKRSLVVLHKCDNPRCFNPDHLFFGDNDLNVADRQAKGRHRGGNGLTNPNAKLDPEKVRVIRLLSLYTSQRALGRKFGVDKSVIRAVLKGETWVHVV